MRNGIYVVESFLTFVKDLNKTDLNTVTHKDILAYIEHEQYRGAYAGRPLVHWILCQMPYG